MINIDFSNLNSFEKQIYDKLLMYSQNNSAFGISKAAEICNCSISKISKYVKKLGFNNYKQYMDFLYGKEIPQTKHSNELNRIKQFIEDFDVSMVDEFIELMDSHEKIVLFGFGPSAICAQYFEYKLRTCSDKMIVALSDEISVESMVNDTTLLVIFTVTGTFRSFENIYKASKAKGCEVAMVVEEYNTSLFTQCDRIFWLSKNPQPSHLLPYEKSRTVFFIFMEEIIQYLQKIKAINDNNATFDESKQK